MITCTSSLMQSPESVNKKILMSLLPAMTLAMIITANVATATTGSIGFTGRVFAATETISVSPNGDVQAPHATTRVSSQRLTDAKPAFNVADANDLLDYFAGYAPESAKVVTITYR